MIVYYKLRKLLKDRKISIREIRRETGITHNELAKIAKNGNMQTVALDKICSYLNVGISEIMEWIPDDKEKIQKTIDELQECINSLDKEK